jgi:hypothetical protein
MTEPSDRRPEPEIIPPGAPLPRPRPRGVWTAIDINRTHYVYSARLGPIGLTLMTLAAGGVVALATLFLLGAAVVGLAAIGVLTVAGVIAGILRGPPRPLR